MPCKNLETITAVMPPEIGGSPTPGISYDFACKLRRKPGVLGWASHCDNTDHNGPCWFWKEQSKEKRDVEFEQG